MSALFIILPLYVSYQLLSNAYYYVLNVNSQPNEVLIMVFALLVWMGIILVTGLYGLHLTRNHKERTL